MVEDDALVIPGGADAGPVAGIGAEVDFFHHCIVGHRADCQLTVVQRFVIHFGGDRRHRQARLVQLRRHLHHRTPGGNLLHPGRAAGHLVGVPLKAHQRGQPDGSFRRFHNLNLQQGIAGENRDGYHRKSGQGESVRFRIHSPIGHEQKPRQHRETDDRQRQPAPGELGRL